MRTLFIILLAFSLLRCDHNERLFVDVASDVSNIAFSNDLSFGDSLSVLDFEYMYNGGGVALGDVNNDGLQDIYFTGNMVTSRLYLNRGNFEFEDITEKAGVATGTWANGVVMVDVNQDGYKDIYVSVGGNRNTPEDQRANLLFINNKNETFTESAEKYGLADRGYGIQSTFFDYDLDGDLDMYLLQNAFVSYSRNTSKPKQVKGEAASTDKLFRNNGDLTFTDVSASAGITIEGFGLGVVVSDINDDGWPDVYVSNDFITNDLVYINNQDGTFSNQAGVLLKHQTYNGMGADVADYNNDALVDIVVLDMLPEDNKRWKLTPRGNTYDEFHNALRLGYEPQYVRNTLQLNNGNGSFSEIGQLAGIEATEWSWSALFADYDNDGLKDLFITNGYGKDITNLDFIVYGDKEQSMGLPAINASQRQALLNELPGIKIHNYMYRNRGDLTFSDESDNWGFSMPTYSNGAAYGDLDNDGDLDLVINNIDEKALLMESRATGHENRSNYIRLSFSGPALNREGIGAKVYLKEKGSIQYQYFTPVRGYLSSVEPYLHFGLGKADSVDSLEVVWPDGKYQLIRNVAANQVLNLDYASATGVPRPDSGPSSAGMLFREVTGADAIDYRHVENDFVDFKVQPILPHMHSRNGPGIAVGDINGDGQQDIYIGGATGRAGGLFIQTKDGKFHARSVDRLDSLSDDMGVLFFDADNDGDLDLYVASGGSEHPNGSALYRDHLYLNAGDGAFEEGIGAIPDMSVSSSCVVGSDYDHDGDIDLFVGGRVTPGAYPMPVKSFLLRNDTRNGAVRFSEVTAENAGISFDNFGMVSAALWSDFDNDGWTDLIVTGEFMPITFLRNVEGKFSDVTENTGLENTSGWWNSLLGGDFDADGDIDYVAGNRGLNSHFRATPDEPLCIHASDYNKDGRVDPVMSYYTQGVKYVGHSRDHLIDQINSMRNRFRTYSSYANATFEESFLPEELEAAHTICAQRFESSYLENMGDGKFRITALPLQAQFSPVYGMLSGDYNDDGHLDILAVGNSYSTEIISGYDDASIGLYLTGDGKGNFKPCSVDESGFHADNDSKGMASVLLNGGRELIVVANNGGPVRSYLHGTDGRYYTAGNEDAYAIITLADGKKRKHEFYFGSSYLSQPARIMKIPAGATSIVTFDFRGHEKVVPSESLAN